MASTVTRARARARVVDNIVAEIARAMVDGRWTLERAAEVATRENVRPGTVEQWASDAGRLLRIGLDMDALRARNMRRLDETYARAADDPKAAVAAVAESNRMLGFHAAEKVSVVVQQYAELTDEQTLERIEQRIAEYTVSESNTRGHWSKRHKRASAQRTCVGLALRPRIGGVIYPCTVLLARIAPRKLDDDNLRGALKACRDGAADALGVNDNDPRVVWAYDQRRGRAREYAVEIEVTYG